ncbi:MAG TPA: aminotransferase class I/II-fold pyridoxal phosphate-dependent enzyme [Actinomycetota bacterium]
MTDFVKYPMRSWVFEDSLGRYDIDLGDSHVQCGTLGGLRLSGDLELNYGVDRGSLALRELIAGLYGGSPEQTVVTHGAQEALYLLYRTLLRPGDRVVTFRPGWAQSWDVPRDHRCTVDVLELTGDFGIDLEAVAESVGRGDLRLVVVNTPCNPTGRRLRLHELEQLLVLVEAAGAYLLADEEYVLDLSASAAHHSERVVSVSSLSKVYGFPGLRVGWMYGPPDVVAACARRKHLTSISNSVLCEALACDVLAHRSVYADRYRQLVGPGLAQLHAWAGRTTAAVRLVPPEGTPFAWVHLLTGESALSFARRLLDVGVLVMPGETLGTTGGFRLTFAREPGVLAEGLRRIGTVLGSRFHDVSL